jgi:hypothetical protein
MEAFRKPPYEEQKEIKKCKFRIEIQNKVYVTFYRINSTFETSIFMCTFLSTRLWGGRRRFNFRQGQGRDFTVHLVQIGSGAHPFTCRVGTSGSVPGDKAAGA